MGLDDLNVDGDVDPMDFAVDEMGTEEFIRRAAEQCPDVPAYHLYTAKVCQADLFAARGSRSVNQAMGKLGAMLGIEEGSAEMESAHNDLDDNVLDAGGRLLFHVAGLVDHYGIDPAFIDAFVWKDSEGDAGDWLRVIDKGGGESMVLAPEGDEMLCPETAWETVLRDVTGIEDCEHADYYATFLVGDLAVDAYREVIKAGAEPERWHTLWLQGTDPSSRLHECGEDGRHG